MDYSQHFQTRETPQSQPIPGREAEMVQGSDPHGSYVFPVDDWMRLRRFLILSSEGGTFYIAERQLTRENAAAVQRCIVADGLRTVREITDISTAGRAPKNDPALFALAMCCALGDMATKQAAFTALPKVARIGTHLFHFAQYVQAFRGWGRGLRRAIARWYSAQEVDDLAYQMVKYRQRDEWAHRDLLRLAHPHPGQGVQRSALYRWGVGAAFGPRTIQRKEQRGKWQRTDTYEANVARMDLPAVVLAFEEVQGTDNPQRVVQLVTEHRLPMEAVPSEKQTANVWRAVLPHGGLTWLIRNLGNLSKVGVLRAGAWEDVEAVTKRITNEEALRKARVHPVQVLAALLTYQSGHGARGKGTWEPVREVVDALDAAFYLSFGAVEPTGKRLVLALDISGSMDNGTVAGVFGLTPRVASSAMAMVAARTEQRYTIIAFDTQTTVLSVGPRQRLDDVCRMTSQLPMGGTDCSLPMRWALQRQVEADAFCVYTDAETWAGSIHPSQALVQYRQRMGIGARLAVVGMRSNGFTIADPRDAGMLDVVGFDTAAPNVIADFIKGEL